MNFAFSCSNKDDAKWMIFGLSGVPRFIYCVISTSNDEFSYIDGSMSNLPSLPALEGFSPSNTSLFFTFHGLKVPFGFH